MEFIVKANEGTSIKPLAEGLYTGVCTKLIDLGWQYSEKFDKTSHKMMIGWDIAGEMLELGDGSKVNRTMWKEYSTSLGEKSKLKQDLQSWRGKAFTIEELAGFNLYQILGTACQIQIIHTERNGNTYANISAIIAIPKGMPKPEGDYPITFFDLDNAETFKAFETLPPWIKDKIKNAENYSKCGLEDTKHKSDDYSDNESDGYSDINEEDDDPPF